MSEILRNIIDRSILEYQATRSRCALDSLSPEQMCDAYNEIYDEFLHTAQDNPWYITGEPSLEEGNMNPAQLTWLDGDFSEVPDDQIEAVKKLVNSIVFIIMVNK